MICLGWVRLRICSAVRLVSDWLIIIDKRGFVDMIWGVIVFYVSRWWIGMVSRGFVLYDSGVLVGALLMNGLVIRYICIEFCVGTLSVYMSVEVGALWVLGGGFRRRRVVIEISA